MKQINLLPSDVRKRAASHQVVPFLALSAVIALAAAGLVWFILRTEVASTNALVTTRQQEAQQMQQEEAKKAQASAVGSDLTNRVNQLNTLAQADIDWERAFAYVNSLTPKDVFLGTFNFDTVTGALALKMTGTAPSNLSFANFIETLRASKAVQTVKVDGYSYDPAKGTVAFSLSWQVPASEVSYK